MSKLVVVFRDRNTDDVIAESRRMGVINDGDRLMVVCRKNDQMSEPSDVTVQPAISAIVNGNASVIIATGETLDLIIPIVAGVAETKGTTNGEGLCDCRRGTTREYWFEATWQVIALRSDGIIHLTGDRIINA